MNMNHVIKDKDNNKWAFTPRLRFIEKIIYDVPVEGNPTIFGGRIEKVLQQMLMRLDPHYHSPDGLVKWEDVEIEKDEEKE